MTSADDGAGDGAASSLVHLDVTGGVATITLDSPSNRNALSRRLVGELTSHLDASASSDEVRAIVLTHTGGTFCAGADLSEAVEHGMEQGTRSLLALLRQLVGLPTPVVAVVDGHCRAGGVGLVGACDVVVAGAPSTFAFTESLLGLAPAIISLTTRSRLSDRDAADKYLSGTVFGAEEAARIGLVTRAAGAGELEATVDATLAGLLAASPQGLRETKALLNAPLLATIESEGDALVALSARLFASEEAREGMTAFKERRKPRWAL